MNPSSPLHRGLGAAAVLACMIVTAGAAPIFTESFNSYSGNQNSTQYETGLNVAYSGNVTGWSNSGAGTMHAVDLSGTGNWAIMFYQDNVITQSAGIAANVNGVAYQVDFDYGTAVYAASSQRTTASDSLLVEVLRADNSVLASGTYTPGEWSNPGNANLSAGLHGTLTYVGDGTGDVRLRIGPAGTLDSGHFEGEIDNISVTLDAAPTLATLSPADDSTDATQNTNLKATFNENIQKGTGNITLKKSADNSTVETFDVATSPRVTVSGATLTIDPASVLAGLTGYYVQIDATAVKDMANNSFAGIADATTWNFTTRAAVLADARDDFQTTVAAGTTADFNGGSGISDTEGSGRWNYLDGSGPTLLTFGVAGNAGQSMYQTTGQADGLPALGDQQIYSNVPAPAAGKIQLHAGASAAQSAVMRWTAGANVTNLTITGDIARGFFNGMFEDWTDNTKFDILVNGVNQFTILLNDTAPHTFNVTGLSISAGQHVEFILSTPTSFNAAAIADLQATINGTLGATSPYDAWANGANFNDPNSEGIAYGMAWMLGAATSTSPSVGLLPAVVPGSGLTMHFKRVHDQGPAKLSFQYSSDLGTWSDPGLLIPDNTYGTDLPLAAGITATITEGDPDDVTVTVAPAGHEVAGKLFGRLTATEN